ACASPRSGPRTASARSPPGASGSASPARAAASPASPAAAASAAPGGRAPMPSTRLGRHARRWISVGIIVVVAGSGGATAWAVTGPSGPGYRTAAVTRADVTQTLLSTGTIEPVSEANVSFPVSGQVSSVSVGLGSHVTAGQVLARLSPSALASDVSAAESDVATANERLAADEASETTTTAYLTTTASVTSAAYVTVDPAGGTGSGGSGG